jgi:hypothetical protein
VGQQRREDWEQAAYALGAGFLIRWDLHDRETLEEAVGPVPRHPEDDPKLDAILLGSSM